MLFQQFVPASQRRLWRCGSIPLLAAAAALTLAPLCTTRAEAQNQPYWVSLDNTPPGTPAEVAFDTNASTTGSSFFDVFIHGFWVTLRQGSDMLTYQQLSIPGLPVMQTIGAPELPFYSFTLGVVTDAGQMTLTQTQVLSQVTLQNYLVWPHPVPMVPVVPGIPEQFARDNSIYGSNAPFPATSGVTGSVARLIGTVRTGSGAIYPIQWNPTGNLTIVTHGRYGVSHDGAASQHQVGTAMNKSSVTSRTLNASTISPWLNPQPVRYIGNYLFIYPAADEARLLPLISQKKKRGFHVKRAHVEDIGSTCNEIRGYIESWYNATAPSLGQHYCLLVGDVDVIPLCTHDNEPDPIPTDDLYGDVDGDGIDDIAKEVYVGRLSIANSSDLSNQVAKILAYEDTPTPDQAYDTAALISYRTDASGGTGFLDNQNAVRFASYVVTPTFYPIQGNGSANNTFINFAAKHQGIISYDGHGNQNSWGAWDVSLESYSNANISALTNQPVNPVIWSPTCLTGAIQWTGGPCFAEAWMSRGLDGAVAVYAATDVTGIGGNLFLNSALFDGLFGGAGLTTQGLLYEYAEFLGIDIWNAYKYLLLGDPSMQIRRKNYVAPVYYIPPPGFVAKKGDRTSASSLDILVLTTGQNLPAAGVQVSLWKAGIGNNDPPDEVLDNLYTGQDGYAHFQLPPLTPGTLYITANDTDANVLYDSLTVMPPLAVGDSPTHGGTVQLSAAPTVTSGSTRLTFGRPLDGDATLTLSDVTGRHVRALRAVRGATSVAWDGADESGARVNAGVYLAHIGEAKRAARIVVVR